ncbi:uncharacterized protein RHOBADRAFT_42568 [Rhodotorula graminis WP1]|uniref:Uncharacterized protein n=1 Tax=Rhodotorula graminis (strain WP1) TaxID=578459 RepID=A0A194S6W7_RHOGW|nr:uncharacterized protein RHOBADRAFT_42568 [Rhodotorula graminis WP1]KPV76240.1 hypothetical protein RHOBADRAFT_42568 [Rhodotorula graminis WP1]
MSLPPDSRPDSPPPSPPRPVYLPPDAPDSATTIALAEPKPNVSQPPKHVGRSIKVPDSNKAGPGAQKVVCPILSAELFKDIAAMVRLDIKPSLFVLVKGSPRRLQRSPCLPSASSSWNSR